MFKKKKKRHQVVHVSELLFFLFLATWHAGILVPQPGMEPVPPAVEVWSLNHWTREVPSKLLFKTLFIVLQHAAPNAVIMETCSVMTSQWTPRPRNLDLNPDSAINQPSDLS